MVGYPKNLNSKFDYEYVRKNFSRETWKPVFKELLNDRMQWFSMGKLETADSGVTDSTHKIIEFKQDNVIERYQYELREDQNCSLLRLGFTVAEVESILAGA